MAPLCNLEVHCDCTGLGEELSLVGSLPSLGCWDPLRAVKLNTTAATFPVWKADVHKALMGAEFKFFIMSADGHIHWEDLPNRCWSKDLISSKIGSAILVTTFGDLSVRLRLSKDRPDVLNSASVAWPLKDLSQCRVEVRCGCTGFGDRLGLVGASSELGNWDPTRAVVLQTTAEAFPIWHAEIPRAVIGTEFKFVIIPQAGCATWESVPNRYWPESSLNSELHECVLMTTFDSLELRLRPFDRSLAARAGGPGQNPGETKLLKHTFKPTVSCFEIPNLKELGLQAKGQLWWQASDFTEFLKVRLAIGKAYDEAVKLGLACSFTAGPNESRRGLGLGREKSRRNNTRAYVSAVLKEQERQHSISRYDAEALRKVAVDVSSSDADYSIKNALRDAAESLVYQNEGRFSLEAALDKDASVPNARGMRKVPSFGLFEGHEFDDEDIPSLLRTQSRGFGLPRETLQEAGLRATGRRDQSL